MRTVHYKRTQDVRPPFAATMSLPSLDRARAGLFLALDLAPLVPVAARCMARRDTPSKREPRAKSWPQHAVVMLVFDPPLFGNGGAAPNTVTLAR